MEREIVPDHPAPSQPRTEAPATLHDLEKAPLSGEYTLVKRIARGGMSHIYLGEDPLLKRQVALKVNRAVDEEGNIRFEKEAAVLAQLAHPNIVPIHAFGVDGQNRSYYSMKLVRGQTLQAILQSLKKKEPDIVREYSLPRLLSIFQKVCDAMAFAHSKGILHRDLKPENIMVGEYGEVLVMDWGLAKTLGSPEGERKPTGSKLTPEPLNLGEDGLYATLDGEVIGTPQYMSPEQAAGHVRELDERCDIYALGAILYAVITLRPPIDGNSINEVIAKVQNGNISPMDFAPHAHQPVPEALKAVTLKAMCTDRAQRYGSVRELVEEIEAYQNGFATQAEHAGVLRQMVLFVKRNRAISAIAALFLLAAALFTARLGVEREQARASEREAVANRKKAEAAAEATRVEAAKALIALADAAERTGDGEQMSQALGTVPRDLRDQTWEYLNEKSDSADLKIPPPDSSDWLEVDSCADSPDEILAVQSSGQMSLINTLTGTVTPLWKAERKGFGIHSISSSADGKRVAIVWKRGRSLEAEVRAMRTGLHEGATKVAAWDYQAAEVPLHRQGTIVEPSSRILLAWIGSAELGAFLEAWSVGEGKLLWQKKGVCAARFSSDEESVFALNEAGEMECLSAVDGALLSKSGVASGRLAEPYRRANKLISRDGSFSITGTFRGENRLLRRAVFTGHHGEWQSNQDPHRSLFLQLDPTSEVLAILQLRSVLGWTLDLRNAGSGALIESRMFEVTSQDDLFYRRIAASRNAFAVAFKKRVMVWRNQTGQHDFEKLSGGLPIGDGERYLELRSVGETVDVSLLSRNKVRLAAQSIRGFKPNAPMSIGADRSGSRVVLVDGLSNRLAALALKMDTLEMLWGPQRIGFSGVPNFVISPNADHLWIGDKIVDFATGRETASLHISGLKFFTLKRLSRSGVWVGSDRVVAPVLAGSDPVQGEETAEARFLGLWNAETGALLAQTPAPSIASLASSPDGVWIIEGGRDRRLRIRSGSSLRVEHEMRAHDDEVSSVIWHPSLPLFATYAKGIVRIWSSHTWRKIDEMHIGGAPSVAFLEIPPDGKHLHVDVSGRILSLEPESFR